MNPAPTVDAAGAGTACVGVDRDCNTLDKEELYALYKTSIANITTNYKENIEDFLTECEKQVEVVEQIGNLKLEEKSVAELIQQIENVISRLPTKLASESEQPSSFYKELVKEFKDVLAKLKGTEKKEVLSTINKAQVIKN